MAQNFCLRTLREHSGDTAQEDVQTACVVGHGEERPLCEAVSKATARRPIDVGAAAATEAATQSVGEAAFVPGDKILKDNYSSTGAYTGDKQY